MDTGTRLTDRIIDRLPNGSVAVFDREYRYLIAGGEGLRAVGLTAEHLTGRSLTDLFLPDEVAVATRHYARAFAGETVLFELVTFGRHYATAASPFSRDDEGVSTIVVVAQEITALVERPDAVEALRAVVQQKDLLLATLGHEMRNPLGAMRMAVRLIRESEERTVRDHARGVLERQITVLERCSTTIASRTFGSAAGTWNGRTAAGESKRAVPVGLCSSTRARPRVRVCT
jgi:signal transduction histidine kinase